MSASSLARAAAGPDLDHCRIAASLLLKDLRADDPARAERAAARFRALALFATFTPQRLRDVGTALRRKHALAVIAHEYGYANWTALKTALDPSLPRLKPERIFTGAAFLNHWFRDYAGAKAALREAGGVLLPYGRQFVVCRPGLLAAHGLDMEDADWQRIGWDWVRPADPAALRRLALRCVALGLADPVPQAPRRGRRRA